MIEVTNLTKYYGPNLAVDHISFTIEKGHVYGFLGPNGAGKSTTMNMITGCLAASEGSVTIDGKDIYEEAVEAKRNIGYLPEIPPLYLDMTPSEYLTFVARAKGIAKSELPGEIQFVMEKTGITNVANRLIRNLSKGYRQRVGIAQAIIGNPEVIILDEPTVGLDPIQIREIRDLIKELGQDHTVILSSHILQEISAVCDYVIMINRGHIVADDTIEKVTASFGANSLLKVDVRASEEALSQALSSLSAGEVHVRPSAEGAHADIVVENAVDLREEVSKCIVSAGLPLLQMTSNIVSLEDVFLQLVEQSDIAETEAAQNEEKPAEKADYQPLFDTKGGENT